MDSEMGNENDHSTVNYEVLDRCPSCGRKIDAGETVTIEPDPLDKGKARAWHPKCWAASNGYRAPYYGI